MVEGVVAQSYDPLTLQSAQSGGVGSIPGRAPPLQRHDKASRTRLAFGYFCDPATSLTPSPMVSFFKFWI